MAKVEKLYPASVLKRYKTMVPVTLGLLVCGAVMQKMIDPTAEQYKPKSTAKSFMGLNNEFLLLPLLGFREAAAGLLWVRCDEFFHSGDYDAILPLVRLITWLDPHAENVYVTGAWHLAYNFTDSSERSDRRYLAPAMALLDEGIENNMNIPDIKFEKGWQCFDKIKDYQTAILAWKLAIAGPKNDEKGNGDYAPYAAPLKTLHALAHAYERSGQIPEALVWWNKALKRSEESIARDPKDYSAKQMRETEKRNVANRLQQYRDRYTNSGHSDVNKSAFAAVVRPSAGSKDPAPWDTAFRPLPGDPAMIQVIRSKVLRARGAFNTADGSRVDVRITDWDYKPVVTKPGSSTFEVDQSQTIMMDALSVKKNKFERELDLSKDPKMYSFTNDSYKVVFSFNPRTTSPHVQDRFGWNGEGLTDSEKSHVFLDKTPEKMGTKLIEGQDGEGPIWDGIAVPWEQHGQPLRMIKLTYKVSRAQILGQKPITAADIVPND